jgi:rubrerythrin
MEHTQTRSDAQIVALLNDLLQLDHDAVQAYTMAIGGIQNPDYRQTLTRFRGDHERHIRDLTELIERHEGIPVQLSHVPTGAFKLAVQAAGNLGSDREVLLAFKSNERQVRDKYNRLAEDANTPDIAEVLHRNAADEEKHYQWVANTLEKLNAGSGTTAGRMGQAFETVHARNADMVEGIGRKGFEQVERIRRSPLLLVAVGAAGFLLARKILR